MCSPKHVEQLRNIGIINSTTRLHLVGSFYEIYYYDARIHEHQGYWKLNVEALDLPLWRTLFGRGYGPVAGQTT
jgi:hypothetical protein